MNLAAYEISTIFCALHAVNCGWKSLFFYFHTHKELYIVITFVGCFICSYKNGIMCNDNSDFVKNLFIHSGTQKPARSPVAKRTHTQIHTHLYKHCCTITKDFVTLVLIIPQTEIYKSRRFYATCTMYQRNVFTEIIFRIYSY